MAWHWMSFVDNGRPEGERFLGVALIEAEGFGQVGLASAIRKAHRLGCNPGGEIMSFIIDPSDNRELFDRTPKDTLLSRAQLIELGHEA